MCMMQQDYQSSHSELVVLWVWLSLMRIFDKNCRLFQVCDLAVQLSIFTDPDCRYEACRLYTM